MLLTSSRMRAVVALGLALGLLTACGSDPAPAQTPPNLATVAGGGHKYAFGPGQLARSKYPDPCGLLPISSVTTILGGPVKAKHVLMGCFWTAPVASQPVLVLTLEQIGSDVKSAYATSRRKHARRKPTRVPHVGRAANVYRSKNGLETRIEVRTRQVYFSVALRSPRRQDREAARYREIVERVAKITARQFTG